MEAKIYIQENVGNAFKEHAMKRFGYGRGSISKAAEEAITQWLKTENKIEASINLLIEKAKKDKDVIALIVFGSYAKKIPSYNDVDMAIVFKENVKYLDKLVIYREIADPIIEISIFNNMPLNMKSRVLDEGKILYTGSSEALRDESIKIIREWSDFSSIFNLTINK